MGRSPDDRADIFGKAKEAMKRMADIPASEPKPAAPLQGNTHQANASEHRFCRRMDGNEGAVVRGLTLNKF